MFRFEVRVRFENGAEGIYTVETQAENKEAASDQVTNLAELDLEVVSLQLIEETSDAAHL
jgi:hypothetical protein